MLELIGMKGYEMMLKRFIKQQPVLVIAFLAALVTVFIIPPDSGYAGYCNRTVLIELFALMAAVAGFRSIGVFDSVSGFLIRRAGDLRSLGRILLLLCFFSSMLVTNDVALITFVPLTLMLYRNISNERSRIMTIVLETAAANLGSMMTPVGNPQNLYLYDEYSLTAATFIGTMLPVGIVGLICLLGLTMLIPKEVCEAPDTDKVKMQYPKAFAFAAVFLLCLLCVFRVVPDHICLIAAVLAALIFDRSLLMKVDYALLATFVCFFVFVGNIARIEAVSSFFSRILSGREIIVGAGLSQIISNVPAAVMLSEFTENGRELMLGVDIGGFGTLIASLASLISFQIYRQDKTAKTGMYFRAFTAVNAGMLVVMLAAGLIIA